MEKLSTWKNTVRSPLDFRGIDARFEERILANHYYSSVLNVLNIHFRAKMKYFFRKKFVVSKEYYLFICFFFFYSPYFEIKFS